MVGHVNLFASVFNNEVASLLRPSQHEHLVPSLQDARTSIGKLTLHHPPLGETNFVVSHDGVVADCVGFFFLSVLLV